MINILLIEDDQEINQMEQILLKDAGYEVCPAFSGTEALLYLEKQNFDLILLDLMLPGMDGEAVLKKVRQTSMVPVICVSAKDDVKVRVDLIRSGADDYLVKPFDNEELLARIESVLRRNHGTDNQVSKENITFKDITLNPENFEVKVSGQSVNLTKREFLILQLLMSNSSKVFTRNNIFESVWEEYYVGEENAVNVHISNLRNKLAKANQHEEYIQTVWGIGFKMKSD